MPGDLSKKVAKSNKPKQKVQHQQNTNGRKLVGKGTYGCVYKPSFECENIPGNGKNKKLDVIGFNYDDYVSKFMKTNSAKTELREFSVVSAVDKNNQYHLGMPIMCKPKIDAQSLASMKQCKKLTETEIKNKYSILLLKNGGYDLTQFCESNVFMTYIEGDKIRKTDMFLLEIHNLLNGLKLFRDNEIVHYDLKPGNILFDPVKCKMTFIDFGLMNNMENILQNSNRSIHDAAIFHWSYPLECGLMNRDFYTAIMKDPELLRTELIKIIVDGNLTNPLRLSLNRPESYQVVLKYLNPAGQYLIPSENKIQLTNMINKFIDGIVAIKTRFGAKSYLEFLNKTIESIDTYAFGFTMVYAINCFYRNGCFTEQEYNRYIHFFGLMYDFNISTRSTNLDALLNDYELILEEHGVLPRLNKEFRNHVLVERAISSPIGSMEKKLGGPLMKLQESISVSLEHDIPILDQLANEDPTTITFKKKCPSGKEYNVKTKRCVKVCANGYHRNDKFNCVKKKTTLKVNKEPSIKHTHTKQNITASSFSSPSPLPPSDVTISRLEREKIAKEEMERIKQQLMEEHRILMLEREIQQKRIQEIQHKKNENAQAKVVVKICPPGKEHNPSTNRCVNVCAYGYERNAKFNCVKRKKENGKGNYYGGYISKRQSRRQKHKHTQTQRKR